MTVPLPAQGSTSWYSWAQQVDAQGRFASLTPTSLFTSGSHSPVSGEYVRYSPSSNIAPNLPAAAAGQRFGVVNVGTANVTLTCTGSDVVEGAASLLLAPTERAILVGISGGFVVESRGSVSTTDQSGKADRLTERSSAATANTSAAAGEIVPLDTSGGTFTLTGPAGAAYWGWRWRAGTATNAPTIAAAGGYTISGAATLTPGLPPSGAAGELVVYQLFGTDYRPVSGFKPQSALNALNDTRYATPAYTASRAAAMALVLGS